MLTCGSFLPFCFPASTARALLAGAMAAIQPVLCRLSNGQQCQNLQSANLQALLCLPGSSYWWVPGVSAPSWSRPTCPTVTRPRPVLDNLLSHWFPNQLFVAGHYGMQKICTGARMQCIGDTQRDQSGEFVTWPTGPC